jgi:hypothetical protein
MTRLTEWYPIYLKDEGSDSGKFPYHPFDEGEAPRASLLEGATQAPVIV